MSMDRRRRTDKEQTIRSDDGSIRPHSPRTPRPNPDDAGQEMGSPYDECGPHVDTDDGEEKHAAGGGGKSPLIVEGSPPISDDVIRG